MTRPEQGTALIVVCPEAEQAVGAQRQRFDRAAQFGVPAHVTVLSPFKPQVSAADDVVLTKLMASVDPFVFRVSSTAWFDDQVVFAAPDDGSELVRLTELVTRAFPDHPPYEGAFDAVTPHVTIGHGQPVEALRAAEVDVRTRLPFAQDVRAVELWGGPSSDGPVVAGRWRCLRRYQLGRTLG